MGNLNDLDELIAQYESLARKAAKQRLKRHGIRKNAELLDQCFTEAFTAIALALANNRHTEEKELRRIASNAARNVLRNGKRTVTIERDMLPGPERDALPHYVNKATGKVEQRTSKVVTLADEPYHDNMPADQPLDVDLGEGETRAVAEMHTAGQSGRSIQRDLGISRRQYDKHINALRDLNGDLI